MSLLKVGITGYYLSIFVSTGSTLILSPLIPLYFQHPDQLEWFVGTT